MTKSRRSFGRDRAILCRRALGSLPWTDKPFAADGCEHGKGFGKVRQRVDGSTAKSCREYGKGFRGRPKPSRPRLTSPAPFHALVAHVDLSPLRPSAGNHPTPLAISVYRLREVGLPTRVGSVYRQGQGRYTDIPQPGIPTRASRSTDSYPLGRPTLPTSRRAVKTCQGSTLIPISSG